MDNLHQEKAFISEQSLSLNIKKARVVVSAEPTNSLGVWGYFINGVGVVIGGGQVIAGAGVYAT
ncbi:DUF4225 domain-containing protein [Erwinia sp. 198]|uniref:DUF4225 domain-containing protein n=1 Tax=Erwinia sp. 198 TaxID=2022746 RepID=UPI000F680634|nr:DUF4225 domain-containing protein [Erwinia sp. 198]